ncbi:hypothetical protein [Cypionkella sp. TWP1-2-1b2]|uniref:hypothetical protein n=1 Tax=Cypionkella sp. TWP1-2-1b2 TaxID=2804675 RepID=UPI003CF8051A
MPSSAAMLAAIRGGQFSHASSSRRARSNTCVVARARSTNSPVSFYSLILPVCACSTSFAILARRSEISPPPVSPCPSPPTSRSVSGTASMAARGTGFVAVARVVETAVWVPGAMDCRPPLLGHTGLRRPILIRFHWINGAVGLDADPAAGNRFAHVSFRNAAIRRRGAA